MDDHASVAFVPGRAKVLLLRVLHHRGMKRLLAILHRCKLAMAEAMRDVVRAVRDEIPPPPLRSPRKETSPDPIEAKFRRYMKDFKRHNSPTFSGRSDVMITEDWLHRVNRIFMVIGLKDDAIRINAATFQFTGEAIHWWDVTVILNPIETMKWVHFERLFLG